jgi:hypothetical protein
VLSGTTSISTLVSAGAAAEFTASGAYQFGYEVNGVGDVDDDGYDDMLMVDYASYSSSSVGKAYLVMGAASGLTGELSADGLATATLTQGESGDYFGYNQASTGGDFNGDGYSDVVVGEYGNDADGSSYGRAYLWAGPVSGSSAGTSADVTLTASSASGDSFFGRTTTNIGDWNGDGTDDLAIGAYWYDGGSYDGGAVFVYFGATSWASTVDIASADVTIEGTETGDYLDQAHKIGDMDGDGTDDLYVGAPSYESGGSSSTGFGAIFLGVSGSTGGTFDAYSDYDHSFESDGSTSYTYAGGVAAGGDFDGNGTNDLLVGEYGYSTSTGRIHLFQGSGL